MRKISSHETAKNLSIQTLTESTQVSSKGESDSLFDEFSSLLEEIAAAVHRPSAPSQNDQFLKDITAVEPIAAAVLQTQQQPVSKPQIHVPEQQKKEEGERTASQDSESEGQEVSAPVERVAEPAQSESAAQLARNTAAPTAAPQGKDKPTVEEKDASSQDQAFADGESNDANSHEGEVQVAEDSNTESAPVETTEQSDETSPVVEPAMDDSAAQIETKESQVKSDRAATEARATADSEKAAAAADAASADKETASVEAEQKPQPVSERLPENTTSVDTEGAIEQQPSTDAESVESLQLRALSESNSKDKMEGMTRALIDSSRAILDARELLAPHRLASTLQGVQKSIAENAAVIANASAAASNSANTNNPTVSLNLRTGSSSVNQATVKVQELARSSAPRTLEKVEAALREAARSKDGKTISVRLDPPQLGNIKADVSMRDGKLHARLIADSSEISTLLREHAHELHSALRRLGLAVEEIRVSVRSNEGMTLNDMSSGDHNFSSQFQEFSDTRGGFQQNSGSNLPDEGLPQDSQSQLDHWVA